jgi:putative lipoprotein
MNKIIGLAIAAVLGLSACSNLDHKTAHEVMSISNDRILKEDRSFNITGSSRIYISPLAEAVLADEKVEEKAEDAKVKEGEAAASMKVAQEDDAALEQEFSEREEAEFRNAMLDALPDGNIAQVAVDYLDKYPAISSYMEGVHLNYESAVDLSTRQFEMIPELVINNHNEKLSIKLPMKLDAEKWEIYVDLPASVSAIVNVYTDEKIGKRLIKEPLKVSLKEIGDSKHMPFDHIAEAGVRAFLSANKAMPADAYVFKEMDAFGKANHARYRVRHVMKPEYDSVVMKAMAKAFDEELSKLQKTPQPGSTEEDYKNAREFFSMSVNISDNQPLSFQRIFGNNLVVDYYLDRKGRMLASRMYMQINGTHKAINIIGDSVYSNYGKPVFKLNPQGKGITWKELKEFFSSNKKEDD